MFIGEVPAPQSFKLTWKHEHKISLAISLAIQMGSDVACKFIAPCQKAGFWRGLYDLFMCTSQPFAAAELALATDELDSFMHIMINNTRVDFWQQIMPKLRKRVGITDPKITPGPVIAAMIEALGGERSADLLLDVERSCVPIGAEGMYPSSFIPPALLREIAKRGGTSEVAQRGMQRDILHALGKYMWSKKPGVVSPQIRAIVETELNNPEKLGELPFFAKKMDPASGEQLVPAFDTSTPTPAFFEETGVCHWGVALSSQDHCAYCTLPLLENPETRYLAESQRALSVPTMVTFPVCGHTYHQFCVGQDAYCFLCLSSRMSTLSRPNKTSLAT